MIVALLIIDKLRRIQLRFADFTDVSGHMRGKTILRILAPPGSDQLHLGIRIGVLMRFHPRDLVASQLILDDDLRIGAHVTDLACELVVIELQRVRNGGKMLRLDLVAIQQQRIRRLVIDDDPAIAIENLAARRENRRALDAVALRRFTVHVRILNLQLPEAGNQENKDGNGQVLKDRDLVVTLFWDRRGEGGPGRSPSRLCSLSIIATCIPRCQD